MSTTGWFAELCEANGLVPATPITAEQLTRNHVLFTVTGEPRPVKAVRVNRRTVAVHYADGWSDTWPKDAPITLIAVHRSEQS